MKYKLLLFLIITPLLFVDAATITNRGIGSARFFVGTVNPSLSAADNNAYDLGSTYTLEAWVIAGSGNSNAHIFAKFAGAAGQRCWRVPYTESTSALSMITSATCDNPVSTVTFTVTLPVGICTHIAITRDTTDTRLYLNGKLYQIGGLGDVPANGTNAFRIGNNNDTDSPFTGTIDDVRIWNIARTAAQIAGSFNKELNGDETGLVAYFTLNRNNMVLSSIPGLATNLTNNNSAPSLTQSCLNQGGGVSAF